LGRRNTKQCCALPGRYYCKTEQVKTTKLNKLCVHIFELQMVSASATKLIANVQFPAEQAMRCVLLSCALLRPIVAANRIIVC